MFRRDEGVVTWMCVSRCCSDGAAIMLIQSLLILAASITFWRASMLTQILRVHVSTPHCHSTCCVGIGAGHQPHD